MVILIIISTLYSSVTTQQFQSLEACQEARLRVIETRANVEAKCVYALDKPTP